MSAIKIYTDGASRDNPGPSASGYLVFKDGKLVSETEVYNGIETNNFAEYMAVILALGWCAKNIPDAGSSTVEAYSDSEIVVRQINGEYKVKSKKLEGMNREVRMLSGLFKSVKFINVPREDAHIKRVDKNLNVLLDSMS